MTEEDHAGLVAVVWQEQESCGLRGKGDAGQWMVNGYSMSGMGVLLVVQPMEATLALEEEVLRRSFGLTQAEARLAAVLWEATVLKEAAGRLGISLNTAKTQLAAVFAKTGTGNQTALIKRLSALVRR